MIIRLEDRAVLHRPSHAPRPPVIERTSRELDRLDEGHWYAIDDVAGADHVVVGRAGVFALHTRRLCGRVVATDGDLLHNGVSTEHAEAVAHTARRVATALARATGVLVTVRPVLVVESEQLVGCGRAQDVAVVASHRIRRWLERQPDALDGAQAFRLRVAAGRTSTWR